MLERGECKEGSGACDSYVTAVSLVLKRVGVSVYSGPQYRNTARKLFYRQGNILRSWGNSQKMHIGNEVGYRGVDSG